MNIIKMDWLEGRAKGGITTFGVPHKRGEMHAKDRLVIMQNGVSRAAQSKPIAYWDDGSVKWSSVTALLYDTPITVRRGRYEMIPGMQVTETDEGITIHNGVVPITFPKSGTVMAISDDFTMRIKAVKTLKLEQDEAETRVNIPYYGDIEECIVEDAGSLRTVIRVKGVHRANDDTTFLRFIVRFMIYKDTNRIDIKHTFLYDADPAKDFIGGLALEIKRKMSGSCFNRRVKIAGDNGMMHEPLKSLHLWRPKISKGYYEAQMRTENVDVSNAIDSRNGQPCADMLENVTEWDSYKYMQVTPDSFTVRKRTQSRSCTYIDAGFGRRGKGFMYIGDENGGLAVGMRHFYEKAPSAINASGLTTDEGTITAWIHPDDVLPLDMRHYDTIAHDQTYYEGFPWVGSDPVGVAATNELSVFLYDEPTRSSQLWKDAIEGSNPAILVCSPEYYHDTRVLGEFSLPDRSTPLKSWLEDELDKAVGFYMREVDQRHWYGLFNYGDVMHTYDRIRHCWRYDMGGYAWQNTELVPTLWLWYAFLRSGRGDIFNMAEAMSRHAADVDVYHFGNKKGLGSRHNVIHWGDSCKEPRIAMAGHHRALYYLMGGDFRIGDVFDDVLDADFSTIENDPLGFFYKKEEMKLPTHARSGPDWSTYCSNWYTEWERHGNTKYRDKIQTGIDDLKKAPLKMVSGSNFEYDPETGHLGYIGESAAGGSHLMVCMGGPETWTELVPLLHDKEFKNMLTSYAEFYYLTPEEKRVRARGLINGQGFVYPYMAASLVGYAARETNNRDLAYKVWQVLIHSLAGEYKDEGFDSEIIENYYNREQLEEMFWISTNFTAQWCLNTIVALEYTKDMMLESKEQYEFEPWTKM